MPLSYKPMFLQNPGRETSVPFRQNRQDFSQEYFAKVKTNQTSLGRTNSIQHVQRKINFNGYDTPTPILPASIAGLFSNVDQKQYDINSSTRRKLKNKGTRSLGVNAARYNDVLDNGPWDLQHHRADKTRREAARKLIEDELRRRQEESILGTASLPVLSTKHTLVSSDIVAEEDVLEAKVEQFYARDLLHAPQIVASKTAPVSPRKPEHKTEYRLPSLPANKPKSRGTVTEKILSDRREKLRKQVIGRLDSSRDQTKVKESIKLPNPNWVTVLSPVPPSSPLVVIAKKESPKVRQGDSTPSTLRGTPDLHQRPDSVQSESKSEASSPLLQTISESPEISPRKTPSACRLRNFERPRSILKPSTPADQKDESKSVRFLDSAYLERVRMFYASSHTLDVAYSKHERKSTSENTLKASGANWIVSSSHINLTNSVATSQHRTSETTNGTAGTESYPPWRALAHMIKTKTRIKRKKKKHSKKKSTSDKSIRPDSPRPGFLSGQKPKDSKQSKSDVKTEKECETEADTPRENLKRPINKGDGFVIKLKANGDLVEEKVGDDEISRPVTDAELSYRIREILSRPVFTSQDGVTSPESNKSGEKEVEPTPRKRLDTALRRRSLPPISSPFLAPELREPENSPFVSACVTWNAAPTRRKRSKSTSDDPEPVDDQIEISPLLLAMRDCRYIRWAKRDELIVEKLLDLEDQLIQGHDEVLEEFNQTRVLFVK